MRPEFVRFTDVKNSVPHIMSAKYVDTTLCGLETLLSDKYTGKYPKSHICKTCVRAFVRSMKFISY